MEFLNSKPIFLVVSAPSGGGDTWTVMEEVTLSEDVDAYLYTFATPVKKARIYIWPKQALSQGWKRVYINDQGWYVCNPQLNTAQAIMVWIDADKTNGWKIMTTIMYENSPASSGIQNGNLYSTTGGNSTGARAFTSVSSLGFKDAAYLKTGAIIRVEAVV